VLLAERNTPNVTTDTLDINADGFYDNGPVTFAIDFGSGCLSNDGLSFRTGIIKLQQQKDGQYLYNP
jgi:hypothetical protein